MIYVGGVTKVIGKQIVLDNVTATFPTGSIIGFQGINGSGKTMLLRVIAGLIKPTEGVVSIDGKRLWKDIPMPESMGVLIENPAFLDPYTGFQNLAMLASLKGNHNKRAIGAALRSVGLDPTDKRKYRKYSLGMKQRLGIAAAIVNAPDVVLLDEPTNALDESGLEMLNQVIVDQKKRGATVLIASHDRQFLESLADGILLFDKGKVRQGCLAGGVDQKRCVMQTSSVAQR